MAMDWGKIFDTGTKLLSTAGTFAGGLSGTGLFGTPGDTSTVTKESGPWKPAEPYMLDAIKQSQDLYRSGQGSEYYPGSTTTPMGFDTSEGYNQVRQRAMDGSPLMDQSKAALSQIIEGQENPYLDRMYDRGAGKLSDNMKSLYSKSGRYGSDTMAKNTGEALGNYATSLYGGAYENDANRRMNAIARAPSFAQADYDDAGMLLGVGKGVEGYQQREIDADKARFDFEQQNPYDRLANYSNTVGNIGKAGAYSNQTNNTQPGATSVIGDIGSVYGAYNDIWNPDVTATDQAANTASWNLQQQQNPWLNKGVM